MIDGVRVARVRQLLADAEERRKRVAVEEISMRVDAPKPRQNAVFPGLLRRTMVKQVRMAVNNYDLTDEVDAYLAEQGVASLSGLDDDHLHAVAVWVGDVMDRLSNACDSPDGPPAR